MSSNFSKFEAIVRRAHQVTESPAQAATTDHPFEARNIHPDFPASVRDLFDNGHYSQAAFEAFKFLDEEVQRLAADPDFGFSLMMKAFGGSRPILSLNPGMTNSEKNEQEGYKFLFAGAIKGIRNPRGHSTTINDDPDTCLDHLSLASMLLRRLDESGLR